MRDLANDAVEAFEVAAILPFVGLHPNTEHFEEHVTQAPDGAVRTNDALQTEAAGMSAAGVVRSGAAGGQAAAAGEGAAAAVSAHAYLDGRA